MQFALIKSSVDVQNAHKLIWKPDEFIDSGLHNAN